MENNAIDLGDPITAKLRDGKTVERLVRQAVAEAVERARKLGFLEGKSQEAEQANITKDSE